MSENNSNADKNSIHQLLIDASSSHNLDEVKRLIKAGANPNYIRYTDKNGWYSGNTHTALYSAVHADFKDDETNYVNVLEALLNAGANPNFKAVRGNWNHCTQYPLFSGVAYRLAKFKSEAEKIRFIQIFVKHGININQSQNHSRSKNWRAYRTHTCFVFQILDMVGVRSKVHQIQKKLQKQYSIQRMKWQRQKKLQQEFNRENPDLKIEIERTWDIQNEEQKEQIKKQPQLSFVQALINFGADPNSYKSQSFWENYNSDYYEGNQDQKTYAKFDESISQVHETILHRAIMNNLPSLVKLLLSKGAKLTKCKLTIKTPVYPNDWPQKLKQMKIESNRKSIKSNEEQKNKIKEALQKREDEEQRKEYLKNIKHYQFVLFKAKRFVIQNQLPIPVCEVKEISCEEITHILDVSEDIRQMLVQAAKLPHNQKP